MTELYCVVLERYHDELELLPVLDREDVHQAIAAFESQNQEGVVRAKKYNFQGLQGIHIYEITDPGIGTKRSDIAFNIRKTLTSLFRNEVSLDFLNYIGTDAYDEFFKKQSKPTGKSRETKRDGVKIFISHSSKDRDIVNKFTDLVLRLGFGVQMKDIFCTSMQGADIKSGDDFRREIQQNLIDAGLVLQFISKNYKQSEICLNEMGAAWVLHDKVVPLILSPFSYDVGFIHANTQQVILNNKVHLLKLYDDFKDSVFPIDSNTNKRIEVIDEFVAFVEKNEAVTENDIQSFFFYESVIITGILKMSYHSWPPSEDTDDPSELAYNRFYYIQIDPINILRPALMIQEEDINRSVFRVTEIQVHAHEIDLKEHVNKKLRIEGEFFTAHTHWHLRKILISAKEIELVG